MSGTSEKFTLNTDDILTLVKNTGLVAAAAALTFLGENLADLDFGPSTAFIVPVATLVIHTGIRWITNYSKKEPQPQPEPQPEPQTEK